MNFFTDCVLANETIRQMEAENDRLRERVVKLERSQLETSIENNRLREALEKIAFTSLLTGAQAHDIAIEALGEQIAVEVPDDDDGRQARAALAKEGK